MAKRKSASAPPIPISKPALWRWLGREGDRRRDLYQQELQIRVMEQQAAAEPASAPSMKIPKRGRKRTGMDSKTRKRYEKFAELKGQGLTHEEIAETCGCQRSTVSAGLRRLRQLQDDEKRAAVARKSRR